MRPFSGQVLKSEHTDPQNSVLVGLEDTVYALVWSSINNTSLTVNLRVLLPDGSVSLNAYTVFTDGFRRGLPAIFPVGQGLLLGAMVNAYTTNVIKRGQVYVQLMIQRGGLRLTTQFTQLLCGGYVTTETAIGFPFPNNEPSMSGRGNLRVIVGTTPSPDGEISETVPFGAVWKLHSLWYSLSTASAVASRFTTLSFLDTTPSVFAQIVMPISQPEGVISFYNWSTGVAFGNAGNTLVTSPLPSDLLLTPGMSFTTVTLGIQPGDQYSPPQYLVEEWLQQ